MRLTTRQFLALVPSPFEFVASFFSRQWPKCPELYLFYIAFGLLALAPLTSSPRVPEFVCLCFILKYFIQVAPQKPVQLACATFFRTDGWAVLLSGGALRHHPRGSAEQNPPPSIMYKPLHRHDDVQFIVTRLLHWGLK